MTPFSYITSLYTAAAALDLVTFFVLAFVCVLQFCFVRRHGDAARNWVQWARHSLALFTLQVAQRTQPALRTSYADSPRAPTTAPCFRFTDRHIEFFESEQKGLTQARGFLDSIWMLFEAGVRVLLLVTLTQLGAGLAAARSAGGNAQPGGTTQLSMAWGAGGLTFIVALGVFGLRCYYWAHIFDKDQVNLVSARGLGWSWTPWTGGGVDLERMNQVTIDIDFALHCTWLVLALLALGQAVRTRALSRSAAHTRTFVAQASTYFVVCAGLFVAQPLYNVIILIVFCLNSYDVSGAEATIVTDVIFRTWPYALILVTLFVLGRKKVGGVWSTQQPFLTKEANAGETVYQTPWGYQVTHQTAPPQATTIDSQAQLNSYYAQPQQGTHDGQYQQYHHHQLQQQQQPHYG
ncbi:hypothetical protein A9K55_004294 [Cordyceps militaris]|uniref:Uncharacterized protein n=1 Tax=Cordyceps militaris TaxID=73501 RepID=A0A2H4SN99_CORMI|nr:hypothetical protein A9K55_004294 [Cordyceps militaris]